MVWCPACGREVSSSIPGNELSWEVLECYFCVWVPSQTAFSLETQASVCMNSLGSQPPCRRNSLLFLFLFFCFCFELIAWVGWVCVWSRCLSVCLCGRCVWGVCARVRDWGARLARAMCATGARNLRDFTRTNCARDVCAHLAYVTCVRHFRG